MTGFRAWRRRLRFGLPTVLGLDERAFLIPYRYAGALPPAGSRPAYATMETLFESYRNGFAETLCEIEAHRAPLLAIGHESAPAPRWRQDWFPRLDAAAAYAIVRSLKPARIVEIGSGHSTRFFSRAAKDGSLETEIHAIDPVPRATLDGVENLRIDRRTVQEAGLTPFESLAPGDILAIDSSHILMPGSDVDLLLNRVLPTLPAGVVVHIHDIFLPDDYPAHWAWRGYNEQLGVAVLLSGGAWRPLFASHFVATRMAAATRGGVLDELPLVDGALESSLWLKKG
jgi:hypothetical protein